MDGSANGQGSGGGHGIIRIRTDSVETGSARGGDPSPTDDRRVADRRLALASGLERQRPADRRSRVVVFGLVWAVLAAGFTVSWLIERGHGGTTDPPATTATPNTTGTATGATQVPATAAAATTAADSARTPGQVRTVVVVARDDVWVRAVADAKEVHAGMLRLGDRVDASGSSVDVVVAEPGSVDVTVDGVAVPATAEMHF